MTVHTRIAATPARLPESVKELARQRPFLRSGGTAFVFREPARSYRDVLARRGERQRPNGGGPVWPLRVGDLPATLGCAHKETSNGHA